MKHQYIFICALFLQISQAAQSTGPLGVFKFPFAAEGPAARSPNAVCASLFEPQHEPFPMLRKQRLTGAISRDGRLVAAKALFQWPESIDWPALNRDKPPNWGVSIIQQDYEKSEFWAGVDALGPLADRPGLVFRTEAQELFWVDDLDETDNARRYTTLETPPEVDRWLDGSNGYLLGVSKENRAHLIFRVNGTGLTPVNTEIDLKYLSERPRFVVQCVDQNKCYALVVGHYYFDWRKQDLGAAAFQVNLVDGAVSIVSIEGLDADIAGLNESGRVWALHRGDDYRCAKLVVDGKAAKATCNRDIEGLLLSFKGETIATYYFDQYASDNAPWIDAMVEAQGYAAARVIDVSQDGYARAIFIGAEGERRHGIIAPGGTAMNWMGACSRLEPGQRVDTVRNGVPLAGFWNPPLGDPKGVVLDFHGGPYSAYRDSGPGPDIAVLNRLGFGVLEVNTRGTPGYGSQALWAGMFASHQEIVEDALTLFDKVKAQEAFQNLPIVVNGTSWGGFPAIASAELGERIGGLILESAVCQSKIVEPSQLSAPYNVLSAFYNSRWKGNVVSSIEALDTVDYCSTDLKKPVVVFHAEQDPRAPWEAMQTFIEHQSGPVETVIVPGATHGITTTGQAEAVVAALERLLAAEDDLSAGQDPSQSP